LPVRLHLRLTTRCNSGCAHCTISDLAGFPEPSLDRALRDLERARRDHGATEVVLMRGEPTLVRALPRVVRRARQLGYDHVQLQTNGRLLAYGRVLDQLLRAGVTFLEVSLFGPTPDVHDAVDGCPGAFLEATSGLRNALAREVPLLVTVPVVRENLAHLPETVRLAALLGVRRVQVNFPRPTSRPDGSTSLEALPELAEASAAARKSLALARSLGLDGSTEGFPLCALDPADRDAASRAADVRSHLVSDVHHERLVPLPDLRRGLLVKPPSCAPCRLLDACPGVWRAWLDARGPSELRPVQTP
jgi:MoaA/NifB/PqqE/SkfB family radical SAM enzyme